MGSTNGEESEQPLRAQVGEIELVYEEFGAPGEETILLVMGLGMQLLGWDERFCRQLAERGYHVVRFDNRDVGLSTRFGSQRVNLQAGMIGMTASAAYTLAEMAADAVGLLDHLGIERSHLVGASMGGMISQTVAAHYPDRVLSLCSIMSGTGRRSLKTLPRPDILRMLLRPPAKTRAEYIDGIERMFTKIGSPAYPPDTERFREQAGISYDRSYYPAGTARQLMAIMASGNRTDDLRKIRAPTQVIHGGADKLVPAAAGRTTAAAIAGARYEEIEGMGHDLPMQTWDRIIELIVENARRGARDASPA